MTTTEPTDQPAATQLEHQPGRPTSAQAEPLVFLNILQLTGSADDLVEIYRAVADGFADQPGFVSYQLLRDRSDPARFVNVAVWTDRESFAAAVDRVEFQRGRRVSEVADGDPRTFDVVLQSSALSSS